MIWSPRAMSEAESRWELCWKPLESCVHRAVCLEMLGWSIHVNMYIESGRESSKSEDQYGEGNIRQAGMQESKDQWSVIGCFPSMPQTPGKGKGDASRQLDVMCKLFMERRFESHLTSWYLNARECVKWTQIGRRETWVELPERKVVWGWKGGDLGYHSILDVDLFSFSPTYLHQISTTSVWKDPLSVKWKHTKQTNNMRQNPNNTK